MIILGLTGSMAMGKSTTAEMFRQAGVPVFDADAEVHKLYARGGEAVPLIKAVFPDAIKNGAVNREALARYMQEDPLNLEVLESFIHPMVAQRRESFISAAEKNGADIVVLDVPLLFETGGDAFVDKVVVVTADPNVQRDRIMSRPGMSEEKMNSLLSRQMPDAEKRRRADYIIYTDRGMDSARQQVRDILEQVRLKGKA